LIAVIDEAIQFESILSVIGQDSGQFCGHRSAPDKNGVMLCNPTSASYRYEPGDDYAANNDQNDCLASRFEEDQYVRPLM
jgi:hypothetical protein